MDMNGAYQDRMDAFDRTGVDPGDDPRPKRRYPAALDSLFDRCVAEVEFEVVAFGDGYYGA